MGNRNHGNEGDDKNGSEAFAIHKDIRLSKIIKDIRTF